MILDTFRQDVRVGLRILFKEKSFCLLAVLVLALGIAGVTTQFTIVNAFVLRGFSFAHPEQLASVGLLDPQATPLLARRTAQSRSLSELLLVLMTLADDRAVAATYILGEPQELS